MKKSRFASVFSTREALAAEDQVREKRPRIRRAAPKPKTPAQSKTITETRKPGRPPGKRTNPDYQSVTTFLRKKTYLNVQKALIGGDQDFGDVVDDLLKEWLDKHGQ